MAARATFALKAGLCVRRTRLAIVAPDMRHSRRSQAVFPLIDLSEFARPPLGPILARVVGDAVDVAEEADRRRATATREQARRDKAWLRHASVKYANDARRRIAARAANRQAVVLKRKQDQASSVVPGHLR